MEQGRSQCSSIGTAGWAGFRPRRLGFAGPWPGRGCQAAEAMHVAAGSRRAPAHGPASRQESHGTGSHASTPRPCGPVHPPPVAEVQQDPRVGRQGPVRPEKPRARSSLRADLGPPAEARQPLGGLLAEKGPADGTGALGAPKPPTESPYEAAGGRGPARSRAQALARGSWNLCPEAAAAVAEAGPQG